jgi:hypothetical protein
MPRKAPSPFLFTIFTGDEACQQTQHNPRYKRHLTLLTGDVTANPSTSLNSICPFNKLDAASARFGLKFFGGAG